MIELYKHITDNAINFIVFLAFMLGLYLGTAVMISYITDHIIKIVAVIRTPIASWKPVDPFKQEEK